MVTLCVSKVAYSGLTGVQTVSHTNICSCIEKKFFFFFLILKGGLHEVAILI